MRCLGCAGQEEHLRPASVRHPDAGMPRRWPFTRLVRSRCRWCSSRRSLGWCPRHYLLLLPGSHVDGPQHVCVRPPVPLRRHRIGGELLPGVIHVSSRSISKGGTCLYCDYGDVFSTRFVCGSTRPRPLDWFRLPVLSQRPGGSRSRSGGPPRCVWRSSHSRSLASTPPSPSSTSTMASEPLTKSLPWRRSPRTR